MHTEATADPHLLPPCARFQSFIHCPRMLIGRTNAHHVAFRVAPPTSSPSALLALTPLRRCGEFAPHIHPPSQGMMSGRCARIRELRWKLCQGARIRELRWKLCQGAGGGCRSSRRRGGWRWGGGGGGDVCEGKGGGFLLARVLDCVGIWEGRDGGWKLEVK